MRIKILVPLLFLSTLLYAQNVPDKVWKQIVVVDIDSIYQTGIVVAEDLVVTTFHGKAQAPDVYIKGNPATILAIDKPNDLMLLKVPLKFKNIAKFSTTPHHPLDDVAIIGYPLNLKRKQVVFQRNIALVEKGIYMMFNDPVHHGHSGSPVYNKKWEVIGMIAICLAEVFVIDIPTLNVQIQIQIPVMGLAIDKDIIQILIKKHGGEKQVGAIHLPLHWLLTMNLNGLLKKLEQKIIRRERKRKPKMKVDGRSVFLIDKIKRFLPSKKNEKI